MDNNERRAMLSKHEFEEQEIPIKIYLPEAGKELAEALQHNMKLALNLIEDEFFGSLKIVSQPYEGASLVKALANFRNTEREKSRTGLDYKAKACWECTGDQVGNSHAYFVDWNLGYHTGFDWSEDAQFTKGKFLLSDIYHTDAHHVFALNGTTGRIIGASCIMDEEYRHNTLTSAIRIELLFQAVVYTFAQYLPGDRVLVENAKKIAERKYMAIQQMQAEKKSKMLERKHPANHQFVAVQAKLMQEMESYFQTQHSVSESWLAWHQQECHGDIMMTLGSYGKQKMFD